jgi:hypothetical protein
VIASSSGREQSIFAESQPGDAHTEIAAERDLYGLGGAAQSANVAHKYLRIAIRTGFYETGFAILIRKRFKVNQLTALSRSREQANHAWRIMFPYSRLYLFEQSSSNPVLPSLFERSAKPPELSRGLGRGPADRLRRFQQAWFALAPRSRLPWSSPTSHG